MLGGKPASVTGMVSGSTVTDNGHSVGFSAVVTLPSTGSGPFPAAIVYGRTGVGTATILAPGTAVINYNPLIVGPRFADVSHDGGVGAGQTTDFGFQGTGTGQGMTIVSCAAS
jgi:hypothetical protein